MEARDLQEPGERINSAKESITCFELNRDRTRRRGCHCAQALTGDLWWWSRHINENVGPTLRRTASVTTRRRAVRLNTQVPNFLSIQPTTFDTVAFERLRASNGEAW